MGAIWRGHKQYFLEYESDRIICGSNKHHGYEANSIRTLKTDIKRIRKEQADLNPRNFVIYDSDGDLEWNEDLGHKHAPAVYKES